MVLGLLSKLDRFKNKLASVPQTPRPATEVDAVGALLDICVQRTWPIAKYLRQLYNYSGNKNWFFYLFARFDELQACGEPHRPEFTVICQLAHIKRTGTSSTKKGAKQIAAQSMLTFVQSIPQNEDQQQIATVDAEPTEKTFRTYRELKKSDIKPISVRIRDRHNHFMRLPGEDREAAHELLRDKSAIFGTNKDKVDLICKALKLRYELKDIPDHSEKYKVFVLLDDYDCVITDKEPLLYDRIIQYFKVMMNISQML